MAKVMNTKFYEADPVYVLATVGFGRIAMLGCNPHLITDVQNKDQTAFWLQQLDLLFDHKHSQALGPNTIQRSLKLQEQGNTASAGKHHHSGALDQIQESTNNILEHLYNIEQMRPLSIAWVILLLVLLAILIGPVDYIVLKRLDRQPLTWLTSTFWIVLFTVGAYYGVQALRAGDLQMRAVTVTDGIHHEAHNWATHYCGIFAPKNDEYTWEDPGPRQWWAGLAPSEGYMSGYGGHYGSRDIYCWQQDGRNIPLATPINIWTMQCMTNERTFTTPTLSAEIQPRDNALDVVITNQGTADIQRCAVLVGAKRGLDVGTIAAGQTVTVTADIVSLTGWWNGSLVQGEMDSSDLFTAAGCAPRTEAMKQYLESGAFLVIAESVETESPYRLKEKDYETHHIHVQRLVVFPNE